MKKWAKMLAFMGVLVIGLSAGLAGCATTSSISNAEEEIIYNGNVAVNVDGYVYFGNSLVSLDEITDSSTYKSYSQLSYLARVNTNNITATSKDHSPSEVDNVSTEVTAYDNSFMFVLGNYIYYATPFTQEINVDGEVSNYYQYTTIYRSKLNGSGKTKLYSTESEITEIEVLKDPETEKYHIVIFAGDALVSINLSNSKVTTLAEDVTSVAMPETYNSSTAGSSLNFNGLIYYTATPENDLGNTNSVVYAVSLSGEVTSYPVGVNDVDFIDRVGDVLVYSRTIGSTSHVFMIDVSEKSFAIGTASAALFATDSTLSDFRLIQNPTTGVELGYIFLYDSNLAYVSVENLTSSDGTQSNFKLVSNSGIISISADGEELSDFEIVAVDGRMIYLATTTGIYSISLTDGLFTSTTTASSPASLSVKTIVTMTAIYDGNFFSFDGTYIYYYAQLEELATDEDEDEDEDSDDEEEEEETDENYYLYRVKANGNGNYQVLGLTTLSSRQTSD